MANLRRHLTGAWKHAAAEYETPAVRRTPGLCSTTRALRASASARATVASARCVRAHVHERGERSARRIWSLVERETVFPTEVSGSTTAAARRQLPEA